MLWTVLAILASAPAATPASVGCIWPAGVEKGACPAHYRPQPGDILLFSTREPWYLFTFGIARTGHPYHSTIVIRLADGNLALLESGGAGVPGVNVRLLEERLPFHFTEYASRKPIAWVRRLKTPLTEEQVERLTCFARKHYTKDFSTPVGQAALALPKPLIPPTRPEQPRWFCSELVLAALQFAGVEVPGAAVPSRFKPRHLHFDHCLDLSGHYEPPVRWSCDAKAPPPGPFLAPR